MKYPDLALAQITKSIDFRPNSHEITPSAHIVNAGGVIVDGTRGLAPIVVRGGGAGGSGSIGVAKSAAKTGVIARTAIIAEAQNLNARLIAPQSMLSASAKTIRQSWRLTSSYQTRQFCGL